MAHKKNNWLWWLLGAIGTALLIILVFWKDKATEILTKTKEAMGIKQTKKNGDYSNQKRADFTEEDAKKAILELAKTNPTNAKIIERMYRLETAHFTSGQYKRTGTAGMHDGQWQGLDTSKLEKITMSDAGKPTNFLVIPPNVFVPYLNSYIERYNGNYAKWNSTNETKQTAYRTKVNQIKNRFI